MKSHGDDDIRQLYEGQVWHSFCFALGEPSVAAEEEQRRKTEGVTPSVEKWLRGHLRKLDGWGVSDLMRTEQSIDHEQK